MASANDISLRLLEIISLLLPVVAILLQVTIRLYTVEDTEGQISDRNKRQSVQWAVVALIVLVFAALNTILQLIPLSYPFGDASTLFLLAIALFLLAASALTAAGDTISYLSDVSILDAEHENEGGRIMTLRRKVANMIHPESRTTTDSNPGADEEEENDDEGEERNDGI